MNLSKRIKRLEDQQPSDYVKFVAIFGCKPPPTELDRRTQLLVFEFTDELESPDLLPPWNEVCPEEREPGRMLEALQTMYERFETTLNQKPQH